MMKQEILRKYLDGKASLEERLEVMKWAGQSDENAEELESLKMVNMLSMMAETPVGKDEKIRPLWRKWPLRMAAAACACAAALALFIFINFGGREGSNVTVQKIVAPVGQQSRTTLSDGTQVWLNSGSELYLSDLTSGKERRVELRGEAFFDVARDEQRPFKVKTESIEVTVLGTRFNVNTYAGKETVVLESGKVNVRFNKNSTDILPGQMYNLDSRTGSQKIENVDVSNYTSWINGYLLFESAPIPLVLSQLESFFGLRIQYDSTKLSSIKLSGKLDIRNGADAALEKLCMLASCSNRINDEGNIEISLNGK